MLFKTKLGKNENIQTIPTKFDFMNKSSRFERKKSRIDKIQKFK